MANNDKNGKKLWNAMIYLAGENNLAEECVFALKEMKRARPRNNEVTNSQIAQLVKVIAQLDAGGLGGNEIRYILTGEDEDGVLEKDVITRKDTTETSYRGVLKDFISSSIILDGFAEHYFVGLSGHGSGPNGDFLSRDVESPDTLSIPKVQWVLREVNESLRNHFGAIRIPDDFKIDVLGLDSCMMSNAEVGYELRNYVKYMVGAEGFEPNMGWPYERILSALLSNPAMEPTELALTIVQRYVDYYSDFMPAGRSVDQAACDLSKCDALAVAVKGLADALIEGLKSEETLRQIVLAHWEAQSYKDDQYVDLYDFCDLLDRGPAQAAAGSPPTGSVVMKGLKVDQKIVDACRAVKKVLTGKAQDDDPKPEAPMVLQSCYSGPAVQYSHGLSVYFPWSHVVESYKDLEFAEDTGWREFLMKYVEVTRRGKRLCSSASPENPGDVVEGKLFFDASVSGFDFLLTGNNKDAPTVNRIFSNKVGTMKNPPVDFLTCECKQLYSSNSTSRGQSENNMAAQGPDAQKNKRPAVPKKNKR